MTSFNTDKTNNVTNRSFSYNNEIPVNAKGYEKESLPLDKHPIDLISQNKTNGTQNLKGKFKSTKGKKLNFEQLRSADSPPLKAQTFLVKYSQVTVLNQLSDQTPFGIENCGFHALKNALIMLACTKDTKYQDLFNDPSIFLKFYSTYCTPLLLDRKPSDPKDASIPMLYAIIDKFLNDPHPDNDLLPLQQIFKDSRSMIAILSTSPSAIGNHGLKGFLGNEGIQEAEKFYNFANDESMKDLIVIFGNESEGHWITIRINKTEDGDLHYFACDSMVEDYSSQGELSQFVKIAKSIELGINHSDDTMLNGLVDSFDELAIKAGWIGTTSEHLLIDDTPNALLATDYSNGSNKEIILEKTFLLYETLKELDWLQSPDIEIQLPLTTIMSLMEFYSQNVTDNNLTNACKKIVSEIKSFRGDSYFKDQLLTVYNQINEAANLAEPEIQQSYFRTLELAKWIIELDSAKNQVAQSKTFMQEICAKFSIEHEFSHNPIQDIERNIMIFLQAYQLATKQGKLKEFCEVVGKPACFTGRMAGVEDYIPRLKWPEMDALAISGFVYMLSDVAISQTISNLSYNSSNEEEFVKTCTLSEFQKIETQEMLSELFKLFSNSQTAEPFLDFLKKNELTTTNVANEIDWSALIPKLVNSKYFEEMFSRGKADAIKQL